jgi:APA family basic amino acid/polyamine antiporter
MMGLGAIIGTGIFVSVGFGAGIAGTMVILAIVLAALVATCNGLNSAQLAANHPVSGGTYEYGYRYLNPALGFMAGWVFLLAKSASAATAALGFAGYLLDAVGVQNQSLIIPLALGAVLIFTFIVVSGIRRSNLANNMILTVTLASLLVFVVTGLPQIHVMNFQPLIPPDSQSPVRAVLQASALMFVAYTGYGRIATMGEEVRDPRIVIPRAIIITLLVSLLLYTAVAFVGIGTVGAETLSQGAVEYGTPLEAAAHSFNLPAVPQIIAIGAVTAMLGVLLNLLLGLSRMLLAMGRRGDMPQVVARLNSTSTTPTIAVIVIGVLIGALVLVGNVYITWSLSAFTVLIYYAITNLSALKLKASERLFPRVIGWIGLAACLFLAFWVETQIWVIGLLLIVVGFAWHFILGRIFQSDPD